MRKERLVVSAVSILLWVVIYYLVSDYLRDVYNYGGVVNLLVSLMFVILGSIVYAGGVMLLSGVNTTPKEELEKYNMDAMASIMGMAFIIASFVMIALQMAVVVYSVSELVSIIVIFVPIAIVLCASVPANIYATKPKA
ncbi:MAG: DUF3784 domain-containing protein [Candidatus Methanoplasma sp.]|jgi:hypothetical protein|nr:DUF3784 domain-containing protein [Candidatus Methanoplasma sp.]